MVNDITVVFQPEGRKIRVPVGTTVLEAAKKASVRLRSECGGQGVCGKCKVVIENSDGISEVTEPERKLLPESEIDSGLRLACRTKILRNILVTIPLKADLSSRQIQVTGLERQVELTPSIEKFYLALPKPSLSDFRPDFERLLDALPYRVPKAHRLKMRARIDYKILKALPYTLRNANWHVTVTLWNNHRIIDVEPGDTSTKVFGLALDIGTSKIVGHLVNLTNGKTVSIKSVENAQVMYGEDIISRITFAIAKEDNLKAVQALAVEGINKVLHATILEASVDPRNVYETIAVGNTAMHHLLLGIEPKYLALSPFTPAVKKQTNIVAEELGIRASPRSLVTFLPIVAGFVGSDAVADLLATGIYECDELSLLIDVGTNTEIFVGNKDGLLCCSCASGPAFEGAHIKHGMNAAAGAVEKFRIRSHDFEVEYETIGGTKPVGICGSAMVDVVAELRRHGIIDRRGRFIPQMKMQRLRGSDGKMDFIVAQREETATGEEITVSQKDINEIQLAKAAIYAGCSILLKEKNLKEEELDRVFIAGAFGNYMSTENAKYIGMMPDVPTKEIRFIGNAAISGAKLALKSKSLRKDAETISQKVRYLELSNYPDFQKEFIDAMFIPHRDSFKSVRPVM